jgi:hypothetical protein
MSSLFHFHYLSGFFRPLSPSSMPRSSHFWHKPSRRKWNMKLRGEFMRKVPRLMGPASTLAFYRTALLSRLSRWSRRRARARGSAPMMVIGPPADKCRTLIRYIRSFLFFPVLTSNKLFLIPLLWLGDSTKYFTTVTSFCSSLRATFCCGSGSFMGLPAYHHFGHFTFSRHAIPHDTTLALCRRGFMALGSFLFSYLEVFGFWKF